MSTEETGTGQDDQTTGSQNQSWGEAPGSGNGAGLGTGEPTPSSRKKEPMPGTVRPPESPPWPRPRTLRTWTTPRWALRRPTLSPGVGSFFRLEGVGFACSRAPRVPGAGSLAPD